MNAGRLVPDYYGGDTTYEPFKVIEAWGLGYHLGSALKYIARAGKKPGALERDDLLKARSHIDRQIALLTPAPAPHGAAAAEQAEGGE